MNLITSDRSASRGRGGRRVAVVAALATAGLLAAGCSSSSSATQAAASAATAGSTAAPAGKAITVTDTAGRTVSVPANLTRIAEVGTTPVLDSMIFLFNEEKHLVNGNAKALSSLSPFDDLVDPGYAKLPVIQASPSSVNAESVVALNPQLVVTNEEALVAPLTAAGLTVVDVSWENPTQLSKAVTLMGKVFNDSAKASSYISYLNSTEATVRSDLKGIAPSSDPRVLSGDPAPLGEPAGSQIHWWAPVVGADNVAEASDGGATTTFSNEQILQWNPQFIFTQTPSDVAGFTKNSIYANVAAVKANQVTATPGGFLSWGNSTPEDPLLLLWLAKQLHPAQTTGIDINADVKSFYQEFYGKELTSAQVADVLADKSVAGS
jgi:iron complex transport system substrate-binding protein